MSRLWLRSEVFDGVLPLRSSGVPLSPARPMGPGGGAPSPLFVLLKALREANPDTVRYTTWITEGWRVLQWSEPSAKLFWEMLCMYHFHSPRLGSLEKVPCGGRKDGGEEKVQAIELPVSKLGLFLFLHLHPDSTNYRLTSQRAHNADSVWPSEEAAAALGGSPRRAGGVHSPGRVGQSRVVSPPAPSSPRGFAGGVSAAALHMYPSAPLSPTRSRSMRLHTRTSDDAHRLSFIKRHLHDLLRVASTHPSALFPQSTSSSSASISGLNFGIGSGGGVGGGGGGMSGPPPTPPSSKPPSSPALSPTLQQQAQAVSEIGAASLSSAAADEEPVAGAAAAAAVGSGGGGGEEEPDLSRSDFEALDFLMTGGASLDTERAPGVALADLCPLWDQPMRSRERVPISEVADFLSGALTVNEVTYPVPPSPSSIFLADSTPASGHGAEEAVVSNGDQSGNGNGNGNGGGAGGGGGGGGGVIVPALPCAPLLVNCACRTTVVHNAEASGPLRDLQVNYCQESYVYVLTAVRFATVMGCKDCTVVIGAAAGMVRVEECERMQLVTCCRRLTVTNSLECIFPVFVATPPVLSGDNRACQFAPYNSCYPRHKAHLMRAGLLGDGDDVPANLWGSPVEASMMGIPSLSADQRTPTSSGGSGVATSVTRGKSRSPGGKGGPVGPTHEMSPAIMPPEQFYTLAVPVPPDSPRDPPAENPFGLPSEYAAVLQEREAAVESLHDAILEAGLTPRQNRELEECIRGRFTEWLVATGNLRQVLDLVSVAEKARGGSGADQAAPSTNQQR